MLQRRTLLFCLGIFPLPISLRLFPTFSSNNFSVYGLMWRSLIHLDLSFVQGDKNGPFVLLTVSFALQKLCNFMRPHLLILDLTAQAIAVLLRNFPPVPISSRLYPTFSSISFRVSVFLWSSLVHVDLSIVQGEKNGSIPILLHDNCQLCQHHFLKMLSFLHWMVLAPLSRIK